MKTITLILALAFQLVLFAQKAPLSVSVTDYSKAALEGEQVIFINQSTKEEFKGVSNSTGKFTVDLPAGNYDIKLKSVGDAQDYSALEIPALEANQFYTEMWMEVMISQPEFFTLNNLHFASGQSAILRDSYPELKELLNYLKLKPTKRIEIAGHTDNDGDEISNLSLSQNRADAVKKYLIENGIKASRLIAKGYGETKPVADNRAVNGKAKNRRTEVRFL
jgi:outer membrane protein OmpA-like peptidoglycan-associated protein